MRFERTRRILATTIAVLAAVGPILQPVTSAAQTPTAEQLKVFQSLPQAQRDAILQQMGAGGAKGAAAAGANATDSSIIVQQPGLANAEAQAAALRAQDATRQRDARIKGGEQLLLELVLPALPATAQPRSAEEERTLTELRDRILKRNPYELSASGVLQLPGFEPIPLAGLTSKEAQERLALDPELRAFSVAVTVLRVDPQGVKALKPYGYDIFRDAANALVPGTDIPVPDDYRIGPGDTMNVQLYGQQSQTYSLPVGRDGTISFPELGPINVGGMGFGAARTLLEGRVKKQMIGTQARVSLSDLRSARVLVLGDAERPGSVRRVRDLRRRPRRCSRVAASNRSARSARLKSGAMATSSASSTFTMSSLGATRKTMSVCRPAMRCSCLRSARPSVSMGPSVDRRCMRSRKKEPRANLSALAGGLNAAADVTSVTLERIERWSRAATWSGSTLERRTAERSRCRMATFSGSERFRP